MKTNNILSIVMVSLMIGLVSFNQYFFTNTDPTLNNPSELASVIESLDPAPVSLSSLVDPKVINTSLASVYQYNYLSDNQTKTVPDPDIQAESALIYNLTTKEAIYTYEPTKQWPLASLTKLITSIVAIENIGLDTIIPITDHAILTPEMAGGFYANEEFFVRDILKSLFLVSSNDGAVALTDYLAPGKFISLMNQKANFMGMNSTSFTDPSGLSNNNISTVSDLQKLMSYIYSNRPEMLYFSRQPAAAITDQAFGFTKFYVSINQFAGQPDFIGGKTGYTDIARGNLISVFSRHNQAILVIVLGTEDRFGETIKLLNWLDN